MAEEEGLGESAFRSAYLTRLGIGSGVSNPQRRVSDDSSITKEPQIAGQDAVSVLESSSSSPSQGQAEFTMQFLNLQSQDDFRIQYLKKLSYAGVWVPQAAKPPRHQTAILFDYDDTLIPSVYLNHRPDALSKPEVKKHLETIASHAAALLELAGRFGHVFIITNAIHGWVFYSAEKYLPALLPTLRKVKVISARDSFEQQYPGQYHQWKIQAFLKVQKELNQQVITNLISLGDSMIEHDAVHVMGAEFSEALVKTIKFRETPTPEELAKQLELVLGKFEKIVLNARNLKISLERKWTPHEPAPPPQPAQQKSSS